MNHKTTCIWDLSGTLFKPHVDLISPEKRPDFSFLFLMWSGKKEASQYDILAYRLLSAMGQQKEDDPTEIIRDHTGKPLPEILCAYLAGQLNSKEVLNRTLTFFETWAPENIPSQDQVQVRRILETFFDPSALIACIKPIEPMVSLFREMLHTSTALFILSNWDADSFELFYKEYQNSIFKDLDRKHICISAQTGYVKPQQGIFSSLLHEFDLNPQECFYIDDQQENITAALSFGIEGFHVTPERYATLKATLKKLHLL